MSFFKRLGKSKTAEFPDGDNGKKKSESRRRGGSFYLRRSSPRDEEDGKDENGLRPVEEDEKEKDKERKKYKDMSGLLVGQQETVEYPTFVVHYLGRIPTSSEYGREAVEEPVNQLCKLREKQKLQRVFLIFNVEGLFCREMSSGPFSKHKKDGFNMHIPLHHITYGVGCAAHPTVFACVAKMNDDPNPANQVLVLHAFVCDKPETTQAITYWQLQAYIEAYEDLKRKRILRSRRKHAIEASAVESLNQKRTDNDSSRPKTVPEEGEQPETSKKSSEKRPTNNNGQPTSTIDKPVQETKTSPPANSGTERPQLPRTPLYAEVKKKKRPQTTADVHVNHSEQPNNHHHSYRTDSPQTPSRGKLVRKSSSHSTGSGASYTSSSSSRSSGHGGDGTPMESPYAHISSATPGKTNNKTFEKRIDELNTLVNMDAEKLKMLMINEHPTLARYVEMYMVNQAE